MVISELQAVVLLNSSVLLKSDTFLVLDMMLLCCKTDDETQT